jgi:hypothetical protein
MAHIPSKNYLAHNAAVYGVLNYVSATFPQLCLWITSLNVTITTSIIYCIQSFVNVYISLNFAVVQRKLRALNNVDENGDAGFCRYPYSQNEEFEPLLENGGLEMYNTTCSWGA